MEYEHSFGKLNILCDELEDNPCCPHGPTLLYERIQTNGNIQRFYACSAYRNRKICPFFVTFDTQITEQKKSKWAQEKDRFVSSVDKPSPVLSSRLAKMKKLKCNERSYCHTCSKLLFLNEYDSHKKHNVSRNISDYLLSHPSQLLHLKTNSKEESQFIFAEKSVDVIINGLKALKIDKVLCMGTPSIHERILDSANGFTSYFLDIDHRYIEFYDESEFGWFNMMNFYFFHKCNSFERVKELLSNRNVVLIMDPPFSARAEPLAYTLKQFHSMYRNLNDCGNLAVIWIFPYFKEEEVVNNWPGMKMLDYDITYLNQKQFKHHGKKSIVRIFTNLDASKFAFPIEEGYHFCSECNRWVAKFNNHCSKCGICPSKNGQPYKHCDICSHCVKETWQHCEVCGRCALQKHPCELWQNTQNSNEPSAKKIKLKHKEEKHTKPKNNSKTPLNKEKRKKKSKNKKMKKKGIL